MQRGKRLYFVDNIRAFAILMMLQGHFVDALLGLQYRDVNNVFYQIWSYFRGITAPVFFTISGFIFTYLLIKENSSEKNPRILKGIKRGVQLIVLGYLLRLAIPLVLITGIITDNFYLIDVLHCIGFALLSIILCFELAKRKTITFTMVLSVLALTIFLTFPWCDFASLSALPKTVANFITMKYGSVFTLIPWVAYSFLGAVLAVIFRTHHHRKNFYRHTLISLTTIALLLLLVYPAVIDQLCRYGWPIFEKLYDYRYLFTRLGDVMIVFVVFILLRNLINSNRFAKIGQNTLSIYVFHYIVLYGGFGLFVGLYNAFYHKLNIFMILICTPLFMLTSIFLAFLYNDFVARLKRRKATRRTNY